MRYVLKNAYVKSWSTSGSAESETFDFDFTSGRDDKNAQPIEEIAAPQEPMRSEPIIRESAILDFALTGDDNFAPVDADAFMF